jgi:hypothetical protein
LIALIASILFIIGNFYKIGNLLFCLLFYTIEKEFFPVNLKKHYIRINNSNSMNKNYSSEQQNMNLLEEDDFDPLVTSNKS